MEKAKKIMGGGGGCFLIVLCSMKTAVSFKVNKYINMGQLLYKPPFGYVIKTVEQKRSICLMEVLSVLHVVTQYL
jgi:hypothetical protein